VEVRAPGRKGVAGGGLAGDAVCDLRHHGGDDQAVYAYAREDLDSWATELGRDVPSGTFGENLTTAGLDVTGARIGERWQIGDELVLEVSVPRIPCRTFAGWLGEQGWVKRFTRRAVPGTYLRVVAPGPVRAGNPITVVHRPDHDVTVRLVFRALTTDPGLLPDILVADALPEEAKDVARKRLPMELDEPV
jgi:MOSC domain-containing protein YiiM